jgi:hypothetical protein
MHSLVGHGCTEKEGVAVSALEVDSRAGFDLTFHLERVTKDTAHDNEQQT